MKHLACWGILLSSLVSSVLADDAPPIAASSAADADRVARQEEKRILAALQRKISFECSDMPLEQAVSEIGKLIDCEVHLNRRAMADEGISHEQLTEVHLREATAWQMLHFLLKPHLLSWVAKDGILEITTRTNADEKMVTRVYDVKELCQLLTPLIGDLQLEEPPWRKGGPIQGMMGGGGGGGFFSIPATGIDTAVLTQFGGMAQPARAVRIVPPSAEAVIAAMIKTCTQLQWLDRDGDGGAVQLGQGCVIVSQSYHGQFEIEGMLETLTAFVKKALPGSSVTAHRRDYPIAEEDRIFQTLAQPITLELEPGTLRESIERVAKQAGLVIWWDVTRLSEEGVTTDAELVEIPRKMRNIPLGICLKKLLEPLLLKWIVEEGTLVVTTESGADEQLFVRFYDIGGVTRVTNGDPASRVVSVLSQSTHGQWQDTDGEGGAALLVSSRHLAVLQTQRVHAEIALLIDDLRRDELQVPVELPLEVRVYPVANADTARDLVRVIPQLLGAQWSARGTIDSAGESLLIKQTETVHAKVEEIITKLREARAEPEQKTQPDPRQGAAPQDNRPPGGDDIVK